MHNLLLYDRLATSTTNFRRNITGLMPDWHHSTVATGGYWTADGTITSEQLTRGELVDLYNQAIGWRLVEQSYGITTWEGEIVQLTLTRDGESYARSLDLERWHNKAKAIYPSGATAWSEDTDSSDLYGESCYIATLGAPYGSTAATAHRDRRLAEYAFPRSRASGGLSYSGQPAARGASLDIMCAGYVFGINRRYRETDTAAAALSTQITTLVGESEFVTEGDITTNSASIPISTKGIPARLWDLIEDLIGIGDTSGNRYVGGVYAERLFDYAAAATAVSYYWRNGMLYDAAGSPVLPPHIKPDRIVELAGVPRGRTLPGGATWDQSNRIYIEKAEFIAPNGYRLTPRDGPALEGRYE